MSSPRQEFAVLLAAPDPVEADLARSVLAAEGIPSMLHGNDRDLAEFGVGVHNAISRPDLLVPKSALLRARELLHATWDAGALTDSVALAVPRVEDEAPAARRSGFFWLLFVCIALLVILFTYAQFVANRPS